MRYLLRLIVAAYPREVRGRYGEEILAAAMAKVRAARVRGGHLAGLRCWLSQALDLTLCAWRERRAVSGIVVAGLGRDLRVAGRRLGNTPGFSLVVVLVLAIGIGGTTALFAVVDAVLLEPLPYPDPHELVQVGIGSPEQEAMPLTVGAALGLLEEDDIFADFGAWRPGRITVQDPGQPRRLQAVRISAGVLSTLRLEPALGRGFLPEELEPGGSLAVIVSDGFWRDWLGGSADAVGGTITLEGIAATVVGVMPAEATFLDVRPQLYIPLWLDTDDADLLSFDFFGIARLRDDVDAEQAAARVSGVVAASAERYGWIEMERFRSWGLRGAVRSLNELVIGDVGPTLWLLLGSVGLLLAIAWADAANLFLIRARDRRRELAARMALGASRARIVWESGLESVMLTLVAGAAGVAFALMGTRGLLALAPSRLPRITGLDLDGDVVLFALILSLLIGVSLAVIGVLGTGGQRLSETLRDGERTVTETGIARRVRDGLAVLEVALAVVLLAGSGLMVRSFWSLQQVDPGLGHPERVLTFDAEIPRSEVADDDAALGLFRQLTRRLSRVPGVGAVGAASRVATDGGNQSAVHTFEDPDARDPVPVLRKATFGEYLEAAGIPLLAGRGLGWEDAVERRPVVLISENLARRLWGEPRAALGRRLRHVPGDAWREVVGVVGDVREQGLGRPAPPVVYAPVAVRDFHGIPGFLTRNVTFALRVPDGEPGRLVAPVREAFHELAPSLATTSFLTLDRIIASGVERTSFLLVVLGLAAGVAILLGAIGVYGVITAVFARRIRELGIRLAFGASRSDVLRLVFAHGGRIAVVGLAIGIPGALLASRALRASLHGIRGTDPASYAGAGLLALAISLIACIGPARRAVSVDPARSLQAE